MLTRIENQEVLSMSEMKRKYPDKHIIYNRKSKSSAENQGDILVTVLYVADQKDELLQIPPDERFQSGNGFSSGRNFEIGTQIGAIVYG